MGVQGQRAGLGFMLNLPIALLNFCPEDGRNLSRGMGKQWPCVWKCHL